MDTGKIIGILVGLMISVLMVGIMFVPTLAAYTTPTSVYENEGVSFALMDDQTHTMIITNNAGVAEYTVDGDTTTPPDYLFNRQSTVVYGEDGLLRVWQTNNDVRIRVSTTASGPGVNLNDGESITVTIEPDSVTYGTNTVSMTPVAYLSNNGTYAQLINPVVKDDTIIYLAGLTEPVHDVVTQFIAMSAYGTIEDLNITPLTSLVGEGVTVTGATYDVTTTDLGNGLKRIDDIAITFTMSDDTTHVGHYTYFIAPAEVTYDNPIYVGSVIAVLFDVLGLVAGVGLLIIATIYFLRRY